MIPHSRTKYVVSVAFTLCWHVLLAPAIAEESKKSLDSQLLDDLDSELLNDLKDLPPISKKKEPPSGDIAPVSGDNTGDKDPGGGANVDPSRGQLAGEDVELGKASDPLARIGGRMRTAKELIDRHNTSTQTQQLQEEILNDLSALIAKLQSQQMQPSGDQSNNQGGKSRPGAGDGSADGQVDQGPEKSTDRVGKADTTLTALQRQQELLRRMNWGSLPDRLRDQVRSTRVEQFLPKYARLIEQYYKRLAEESQFQP